MRRIIYKLTTIKAILQIAVCQSSLKNVLEILEDFEGPTKKLHLTSHLSQQINSLKHLPSYICSYFRSLQKLREYAQIFIVQCFILNLYSLIM